MISKRRVILNGKGNRVSETMFLDSENKPVGILFTVLVTPLSTTEQKLVYRKPILGEVLTRCVTTNKGGRHKYSRKRVKVTRSFLNKLN